MTLIREALIPIFGIAFGITFTIMTQGLPAESTIFPRTVFVILAALALIIVVPTLIPSRAGALEKSGDPVPRETYIIAALTVAFVAAFSWVGFIPSSIVFIIVSMLVLGRSLLSSVISAVLVTASLYVLFVTILGLNL